MNDAYYNQGTDMLNALGDLEVIAKEDSYYFAWKEEARKYAESKMPAEWDRHDEVYISKFYVHMLEYAHSLIIKQRP